MDKNDLKVKIKSVITSELSFLLKKISEDFEGNFTRKVNNWTLSDFDEPLIAHMVFVSSFESKSGNMFQKIAKAMAILKYGKENVPLILPGNGITKEDIEEFKEGYDKEEQIILSKLNISKCQKFITNFKEEHKAEGRGNKRTNSTLTQDSLKEINKEKFEENKEVSNKPVDLAFYNPQDKIYYLIEIKAGGDLDSSNAPGNVIKMLTEYAMFGKNNTKLYFATLYNKNGEGNSWTGIVKQYFTDEILLIGKDFWELILPSEISFVEFTKMYDECSKELGVNKVLNELIKRIDK